MTAEAITSTAKSKIDWILVTCLAVLVFYPVLIIGCSQRSYLSANGMTKEQVLREFGEPDSTYNNGVGDIWNYDVGIFRSGCIVIFNDSVGDSAEILELSF